MNSNEILSTCNKIFIEQLDNENIVLTRETTAKDIGEWDSLTNIQLIVAIEKYFKFRFTSVEIQSLKNVGDLCDAIARKTSKKDNL